MTFSPLHSRVFLPQLHSTGESLKAVGFGDGNLKN